MIRIALDASGGDHAPAAPVGGAIEAVREHAGAVEIVLLGRRGEIEAALEELDGPSTGLTVLDAPEVITMDEKPLRAVRTKRGSSVVMGFELQRRGEVDAFVSAGNTGAVMAAGRLALGLHDGVDRPAIGAILPTGGDPVLIMDAGANVDCSARELAGFAHLGAVYARDMLGRSRPRVGLLNVGHEPEKGNEAVRGAMGRLQSAAGFEFVGNVEGGDILDGKCDVFVCDGFVGNIVLKFYESMGRLFADLLEQELDQSALRSDNMARLFRFLDYASYGGAPLLGVRGVAIICHGRSSTRAFRNAIGVAVEAVTRHLDRDIGAEFAQGAVA